MTRYRVHEDVVIREACYAYAQLSAWQAEVLAWARSGCRSAALFAAFVKAVVDYAESDRLPVELS